MHRRSSAPHQTFLTHLYRMFLEGTFLLINIILLVILPFDLGHLLISFWLSLPPTVTSLTPDWDLTMTTTRVSLWTESVTHSVRWCMMIHNWWAHIHLKILFQEARAQATQFENNVRQFEAQFGGELVCCKKARNNRCIALLGMSSRKKHTSSFGLCPNYTPSMPFGPPFSTFRIVWNWGKQ